MTDSMARPTRPKGVDTRSAGTEKVLYFIDWMAHNARHVTIAAVILTLIIGAGWYYSNYRRSVRQQAALQLEQITLSLSSDPPAAVRTSLESFLARFGGSPSADRARLLLAQLELQQDSAAAAIETLLKPASDEGSEVRTEAMSLLAAAYEQADKPDEAIRWYAELADNARFDYQRREAEMEQARLLAAAGRYGAAEAIYAKLAADAPGQGAAGDPDLAKLRLGEVRALAAATSGSSKGEGKVDAEGKMEVAGKVEP